MKRATVLVLLFLFAVPAAAQKLNDAGQLFGRSLLNVPWSPVAGNEAVGITIRQAKLGSWSMLNAVQYASELPKKEREALDDIARITIKKRGWFMGSDLRPGRYRLGLMFERRSASWVLRNEENQILGTRSIVIYSASDKSAQAFVYDEDGVTIVRITIEGISFRFRFAERAVHDSVFSGLQKVKKGRVTLYSDLDEDWLTMMAGVLDKSVDAQTAIYGGDSLASNFDLYLVRSKEVYDTIDHMLAGGEFANAGGFASKLTRCAYFHVQLAPDPLRDGKTGYPITARAGIIHEMNHLVAHSLRPGAVGYWAEWFAEGLAELGVELALEASGKGDGERYYRKILGEFRHHQASGTLPTTEDLLAGRMDTNRQGYYVLSYLVCRALYQKKLLPALLEANSKVAAVRHSRNGLRALVAKEAGSFGAFCRIVMEDALAEPAEPAEVHGYLDRSGPKLRVTALNDSDARAILPIRHTKDESFRLPVRFSFIAGARNQADVYFGYHSGRHASRFYKVAILPRRVQFFRQLHGNWTSIGTVKYDKGLDIGEAGDLRWIKAVVSYKKSEKKVRVTFTGGRWAAFDLPEDVPLVGGRIGIGTWGGTAWFMMPRLIEPK